MSSINTLESNHGRKTMSQEIKHTRVNNPDLLAPIGEFTDNSESWGKATKGCIVVRETKIAIVDNGEFNRGVFPKMFTSFKTESMERYNNVDASRLGKFNAGSTDSVVLLGDKATTFHNFVGNGGLMKTTFNLENVIISNSIEQNEVCATKQEIQDFIRYQKLINPDYDINIDRGTVIFVENLRFPYTDKSYLEIKRFMTGLYDVSRPSNIVWNLYNYITKSNFTEPSDIIEPQDLSFGCESICENMYVYRNTDGKKEYLKNKHEDYEYLYTVKITTFFFEECHIMKEKKIFGNSTDEERVGFQIRRAGRLLTGIKPKRFNISTGANRMKGIRKILDIPACDEADEEFNIGTFKKITDDSWQYFNPDLQDYLEKNFRGSGGERDRITKVAMEQLIKCYIELKEQINPEAELDTLITMKKTAQEDLDKRLKNKHVIKRKNGKAYQAIVKYIEHLTKIIEERNILDKVNKKEPIIETKLVSSLSVDGTVGGEKGKKTVVSNLSDEKEVKGKSKKTILGKDKKASGAGAGAGAQTGFANRIVKKASVSSSFTVKKKESKTEFINSIKTIFDEAKERYLASINECDADTYSKDKLDKLTNYLNKISVM